MILLEKMLVVIERNNMRYEPKTLWFTGLSGSGKSTIAEELLNHVEGSWILDGDVEGKISVELQKSVRF
jgi:adenylylsulfate kinase-like enzyme